MNRKGIEEFKESLKGKGITRKAILSDEDMARVHQFLDLEEGVIDTPSDELRYIEGLFNLPLGYIEYFKMVPAPGSEQCRCGRVSTALDIVYFALSNRVHERELLRDTLIGHQNIFELSSGGRRFECFNCGQELVSAGYYKQGYAYA